MKTNHIAKLVIHGLPSSMKRRRYELAFWLREIAKEIEIEDPKIFAEVFTARYMKQTDKKTKGRLTNKLLASKI